MSEAAPAISRGFRFQRELTSAVALPLLIWIIGWADDPIYVALIALISIVSLHEFLTFGERKGYEVHKVLSIALLLFLLSTFLLTQLSVEIGVFAVLLFIPAAYVLGQSSVEAALPASAVCVLGTLYVGMLSGALLRLRLDFPEGSKLIFFLLIVVWMCDAGAFYLGKQFGKRPLSARVSPKKTIEGLIGGIFFAVAGATVIHFTFFPSFPLVHAIIAAILLSVAGVLGDLAESLWKRSAAVKDSGTLIPGHGGLLDRLDSILFTAPILYTYWFMLTQKPGIW